MKHEKNFKIFVVLLFAFHGASISAQDSSICTVAAQSLREASRIRKLAVKKEVPCLTQNRAEIEQFLRATIHVRLPPNKLKMEEIVYRAIGMVPEQFDYVEGVLKLYVSQLGGYYDPEKRHFVMANWIPAALQKTIAVHELTHALQDQHFNLDTILDSTISNGDMLLARSALIEGDATAVMLDSERLAEQEESLAKLPSIDMLFAEEVLGSSAAMASQEVPETIKSFVLFPYSSGLRFAHELMRRGGRAEIDKAFRKLPRSSREILHPKVYFGEGAPSIEVSPASLDRDGEVGEPSYSDVIGEFGIIAMLGSGMSDKRPAIDAGQGWLGDLVGVFEQSETFRIVSWRSVWEQESDAKEFASSYTELIRRQNGVVIGAEWSVVSDKKRVKIEVSASAVSIVVKVVK